MEIQEFIEMEVAMIKNQFGLSQIKDDVKRYVFRKFNGTYTIDTMIEMCMEIYAEIIKKSSNI